MGKEIKTNVMRILDKNKITYTAIHYECDEFIDGLQIAKMTNKPVDQSFKTLVAQGKSQQYYVFVIPIAEELHLKNAAKTIGEKSIEMVSVKNINQVTGYIRGGCSPVGMRKKYPTVIDRNAEAFEQIYVSGGRIGTSICLNPQDLAGLINASFADVCSSS